MHLRGLITQEGEGREEVRGEGGGGGGGIGEGGGRSGLHGLITFLVMVLVVSVARVWTDNFDSATGGLFLNLTFILGVVMKMVFMIIITFLSLCKMVIQVARDRSYMQIKQCGLWKNGKFFHIFLKNLVKYN